jgi:hypothetical protein
MASVWSSYGHRFYDGCGEGCCETCMTCGATYRIVETPDDTVSTHAYQTNSGEEPDECTGNTSMVHGYERYCDCEDGCENCAHNCNCVLCD